MYQVVERHLLKKHIKNLKAASLFKTYGKIIDELQTDPLKRTHHFEILEKRSPKPNLYSKRIIELFIQSIKLKRWLPSSVHGDITLVVISL